MRGSSFYDEVEEEGACKCDKKEQSEGKKENQERVIITAFLFWNHKMLNNPVYKTFLFLT